MKTLNTLVTLVLFLTFPINAQERDCPPGEWCHSTGLIQSSSDFMDEVRSIACDESNEGCSLVECSQDASGQGTFFDSQEVPYTQLRTFMDQIRASQGARVKFWLVPSPECNAGCVLVIWG